MKKSIQLVMAVMIISVLAYSAWFAYNKFTANKGKEVTVQYIIGEDGSPDVTYIENNVSPNKLMKIINEIESMRFLDLGSFLQVYTVKIKVN